MTSLVPLSDIATIIMGQSPPGETYNTTNDGLPFFQGKAEFGDESPAPVKWCSAPSRVAEAGDILLSVRAPVGPTNIAAERCCIGRGLAAIRAKDGVASTRYLSYFFRRFESEISSQGVGSTFTAINRNDIERLRIPLPPLPEQQRLVRLLNEADALRRLRARADARLAEFIPALFHEMFGDPARNEKGWPISTIGELAEVKTGGTPSRTKDAYFNGAIPWVKTTEVVGNVIFDTEEKISDQGLAESNCQIFPVDAVIIAMYGQGLTRGRSAKLGIPAATNQACAAILPSPKFNPDYLWSYLQLSYNPLRDLGRGGNQPNLNLSIVKGFKVPLPSLSLQRKFAVRVASFDALRTLQGQSAARLAALFESMLAQAFAGEL